MEPGPGALASLGLKVGNISGVVTGQFKASWCKTLSSKELEYRNLAGPRLGCGFGGRALSPPPRPESLMYLNSKHRAEVKAAC